MPRLTKLQRDILAHALVDYSAKIPGEYAFAWPKLLMEIAGVLDITERINKLTRDASQSGARKRSSAVG